MDQQSARCSGKARKTRSHQSHVRTLWRSSRTDAKVVGHAGHPSYISVYNRRRPPRELEPGQQVDLFANILAAVSPCFATIESWFLRAFRKAHAQGTRAPLDRVIGNTSSVRTESNSGSYFRSNPNGCPHRDHGGAARTWAGAPPPARLIPRP
jgi:hypothetical protein